MAKVKSAERTLKLIEAISRNTSGLTYSEIRTILEAPKSSTFNLIQELVENDYLSYSEHSRKYVPGKSLVRLAANFIGSGDLVEELKLLTNEVSIKLKTVSHAGILDDTEVIYLARSDHFSEYSLMKQIGGKLPAQCTAIGKILLTQYNDETILRMYEQKAWKKLTVNSLDNVTDLIKELDEFRKKGYAVEHKEATDYAHCIALPIRQNGEMIAAVSCTYGSDEIKEINIEHVLEIITGCRDVTEKRLNLLL